MNPETPSVTSLTKPNGLPRKSVEPRMRAACDFNSSCWWSKIERKKEPFIQSACLDWNWLGTAFDSSGLS